MSDKKPQDGKAERKCAWCEKHLGWQSGPAFKSGDVSHGICKPCSKKHFGPSENKNVFHELALIGEDNTFQPSPGVDPKNRRPKYVMSNTPHDNKGSELPPYKETDDASTKKTKKLTTRYYKKNQALNNTMRSIMSA